MREYKPFFSCYLSFHRKIEQSLLATTSQKKKNAKYAASLFSFERSALTN